MDRGLPVPLSLPTYLAEVLAAARDRGLLGPVSLDTQVDHALGFAVALGDPPPSLALDLGSGGGLPGLVLAAHWPRSRWVLLDSSRRRTQFLDQALRRLGWQERVEVVCERAESAAWEPRLRGRFDVVTARGFGRPALVAECGGAFLSRQGRMAVSDPPGGPARWPADALARLGMRARAVDAPYHYQVLTMTGSFPDRYPRRVGVPAKRPLF